MTNQQTIDIDMQDAMLRRNFDSLTTTLAVLVPWGPYSISDRIDLHSYHSKFNLLSARVLSARLEVVSANLADWEYHSSGIKHELDDDFYQLEDVTAAARMHLLDVPFDAMDPLLASGGNVDLWEGGRIIAEGGSNLKFSAAALAPFFLTGG